MKKWKRILEPIYLGLFLATLFVFPSNIFKFFVIFIISWGMLTMGDRLNNDYQKKIN